MALAGIVAVVLVPFLTVSILGLVFGARRNRKGWVAVLAFGVLAAAGVLLLSRLLQWNWWLGWALVIAFMAGWWFGWSRLVEPLFDRGDENV